MWLLVLFRGLLATAAADEADDVLDNPRELYKTVVPGNHVLV